MKGNLPGSPTTGLPAELERLRLLRLEEGPSTIRWRQWLIIALIALLFHVLLLAPRIPNFLSPSSLAPPRVDIQQVDPRKLEEIRKKWRDQEKQLLLDKNKSQPTAKEPPPDADYMSDRNMRTDKQQRAKRGVVVPKPGAPGEPQQPSAPKARPNPRDEIRKLPDLGNLGVPLPKPKQAPLLADSAPPRQRAGEDGGEQLLLDKNVPEGSQNILNAQESVYYSFYARLYEAIGPVWQSKIRTASRQNPPKPGEYITQLDVVFDRNGKLVAVNQASGSGVPEFDAAARDAWRSMGGFPNPPSGLLNAEGQVHTGWTFTVQVTSGFGLESRPPEQVY